MKSQKQKNQEIVDSLLGKIIVTRRIHQGWEEWQKTDLKNSPYWKKLRKIRPNGYFGKYQYIYESPKGQIDLIFLYGDLRKENIWEIYSDETLFPDVQRFRTKKDAEARIKYYLEVKQ